MADVTAERLDRILYILPRAIRDGGATLDELAAALGCRAGEILGDLEEITARAYYQSAGAGDQLQILIDGNRVQVFAGHEFAQPVRLTPREALALELGLRTLAAESPELHRPRMLDLAARLAAELTAPAETTAAVAEQDAGADRTRADGAAPIELDTGDDGFRGAIAQAAAERRRCILTYLRPGDEEPSRRDIAPWLLVHSSGSWYVIGHDADRDGVRTFRMDRIIEVHDTAVPFEVPADFDAAEFISDAGVYRAAGLEEEVVVRYSAGVARWIAERMPVELQPDGSIIVKHRVSDPGWLVRHVLRYGSDASVVEPPSIRALVAATAFRQTA